jgi:hypothetical protein
MSQEAQFFLDFIRAHWLNLVFLVPLFIAVFFVFRRSVKSDGRTVFAPPTRNEWHDPLLEQVVGRAFANGEKIEVDGKHFVRCVFRNCSFHYSGGVYEMTDCTREAGNFNFSTDNPSIVGAMGLLNFIGITQENVAGAAGERG